MGTCLADRAFVQLRAAALGRDGGGLSDGQLLERFVARRDEAAFAALVRRHGPMVLGVCRRVVGCRHSAEDAFQATFLVLARKAPVLGTGELGNWLYGVARRTALKARSAGARWRRRLTLEDAPEPLAPATPEPPEWLAALDREVARLPEGHRAAVVLCELEGLPRKEAARRLGLPEGTLSSRLAAARKRLARRLARFAPAWAGGSVAAWLGEGAAPAAVPVALVKSTVHAATHVAGGAALSAAVPASVAALTKGVLHAMLLTKLKTTAFTLALVAAAGMAVGVAVRQAPAGEADKPKPAKKADPNAEPPKKPVKAPADNPVKKEKAPQGPFAGGVVRSVDAGKKTLTVALFKRDGGKKGEVEEKTFTLAPDAKVYLDDTPKKGEPSPEGTLADLTEGCVVMLRLAAEDGPAVEVRARGPQVNGTVKVAGPGRNTLTLVTKSKDGAEEQTLELARDVRIIKDDGLGKKGDAPREGRLADLTEGTHVFVQLSVNRKTALMIRVQGGFLMGTLAGYDAGNRSLTVTVKGEGGPEDRTVTVKEGARIEGDLTPGARVGVQLSVDDKNVAVAVKAVPPGENPKKPKE